MGVLNFLEGSYLKREDLYLLLFSFELMYPYLNREILLLKHSAKWRNSVFVLTRDLPSEMYLNDWAIFKNGKIWQVILILQYAPNWEITRKKKLEDIFCVFLIQNWLTMHLWEHSWNRQLTFLEELCTRSLVFGWPETYHYIHDPCAGRETGCHTLDQIWNHKGGPPANIRENSLKESST